jgi:23S rRNA (guanosine2251-2'-O)-methyltransferase
MTDRVPFRATDAGAAYLGMRLPAAVLLDNVRSMYNTGAFFRTADGAGIERLILSGITPPPSQSGVRKTALGAEETVRWETAPDPLAAIRDLRDHGYEIAAVETSARSVDLYDWQPHFPLCLIFGHEVDGIRPELLELCDTHVRIPMLGKKHSLNVATAAGVVLYELLRKYRSLVQNGG